jgi:hypothetical protein
VRRTPTFAGVHRDRSRLAGFDAHLTKPLDHDALSSLIASLSSRSRTVAGTAA